MGLGYLSGVVGLLLIVLFPVYINLSDKKRKSLCVLICMFTGKGKTNAELSKLQLYVELYRYGEDWFCDQ